jgi:predicted small secreted protein
MKRLATALLLVGAFVLAGCNSDADIASQNISTAADNFEINRRIVFINTWTGEYLYTVEGLCSFGNSDTDHKRTITCKTGPGQYKKHYLGLNGQVTYFAEQLDPAPAGTYQYRVIIKPLSLLPAFELK